MPTVEKTRASELGDLQDRQLAALIHLIEGMDDRQLSILAAEISRRIKGHRLVEYAVRSQTNSELRSIVDWFSDAVDLHSRGLNVQP